METRAVTGPSLEELQSSGQLGDVWESGGLAPAVSGIYARDERSGLAESIEATPLYDDLVGSLLEAARSEPRPHAIARHVCAVLAGWAYAEPDTVARIMARLGLPESRCRHVEVINPSMLIRSAAHLVRSKCGRVALLAYRGSGPFELATWTAISDLRPPLVPVQGPAAEPRVHGVFYRNQRATWDAVLRALEPSLAGDEDGEGLEALFITGHGLGGALALLAAYRLATASHPREQALGARLAQVYTFGQPMVGNAGFARAWREVDLLQTRVFCHSYGRDVVPHLPPRGAVPFRHVGKHFTDAGESGGWTEDLRPEPKQAQSVLDLLRAALPVVSAPLTLKPGLERLGSVGARGLAFLRGLLFRERETYSLHEHLPTHYVVCSQPPDKRSEFGDGF